MTTAKYLFALFPAVGRFALGPPHIVRPRSGVGEIPFRCVRVPFREIPTVTSFPRNDSGEVPFRNVGGGRGRPLLTYKVIFPSFATRFATLALVSPSPEGEGFSGCHAITLLLPFFSTYSRVAGATQPQGGEPPRASIRVNRARLILYYPPRRTNSQCWRRDEGVPPYRNQKH